MSAPTTAPDLTVIVPTRDRRAILCETLDRLEAERGEVGFEAIVVDDGSTDDTIEVIEARAERSGGALTLLRERGRGPATARNRGLAAARAPACLFIDDDTWPRPGLLARHRDFHRGRPEREAALLGRVEVAPSPPPTPFMRWLASLHLGYSGIEDPESAGGRYFFTGNVSAKTELLRAVGGFDEGYRSAAHDDIDLGVRLEARGMRLAYDPEAAVEHYQPTDLRRSIERMYDIGYSLPRYVERHPGRPVPRRPGARHRLKGGVLTALAAARVRTPRVQHETWRFLCHEAAREGYWGAVDGEPRRPQPGPDGLRIGRALARLATRDRDARMPHQLADRPEPHEPLARGPLIAP